jgi:hypothetical protein
VRQHRNTGRLVAKSPRVATSHLPSRLCTSERIPGSTLNAVDASFAHEAEQLPQMARFAASKRVGMESHAIEFNQAGKLYMGVYWPRHDKVKNCVA